MTAFAMDIYAKSIDSRKLNLKLDVEPSDTVDNVKTKIQDQTQIPPEKIDLIFAGKILEDENTLSSYNVQRDSVLHIVCTHISAPDTVDGQAATCAADGWITAYKCTDCGTYFTDSTLTDEIGDETAYNSWKTGDGKIAVDADAHDYPDTWEQEAGNDKQHRHVCANDDTHIEYADHAFGDPTVTKNADDGAEGEIECTCTDCGYVKTEKFGYKVTAGNGSKYTLGSKKDLAITANGEFSKFRKLQIDGADLDTAKYTAVSGSTKATIKSAYLETLKTGEHTIRFIYSDGSCSGKFNISKKSGGSGNPETGDADRLIASVVLVNLALTMVFAAFVIMNKRGGAAALAAASGIETVTGFDADAVIESVMEITAKADAEADEE